jgi:SAM-dependent methyltransferase
MNRPVRVSVKELAKRIIFLVPGATRLLEVYRRFRPKEKEVIFTHYYTHGGWDSIESASGPGSEVECTQTLRREISRLIETLGVRSVLDAPCGDYNWFRLIPRGGGVSYLGADIVTPLVERNRKRYANENTDFIKLDVTHDRLPRADLLICRDCLMHLSNQDIFSAIANFLSSDFRHLLITTHTSCNQNTDILTGRFRPLNLRLPPFSFPEPLQLIDDHVQGGLVIKMGLWETKTLRATLAFNKAVRLR